jgi:hypothetical protein
MDVVDVVPFDRDFLFSCCCSYFPTSSLPTTLTHRLLQHTHCRQQKDNRVGIGPKAFFMGTFAFLQNTAKTPFVITCWHRYSLCSLWPAISNTESAERFGARSLWPPIFSSVLCLPCGDSLHLPADLVRRVRLHQNILHLPSSAPQSQLYKVNLLVVKRPSSITSVCNVTAARFELPATGLSGCQPLLPLQQECKFPH